MAHLPPAPPPATAQHDLNALSSPELRARYRALAAKELPKHLRRDILLMAVAHADRLRRGERLNAVHQRQLNALVAAIVPKGDVVPARPPQRRKLRIGTRLVRQWHSERHEVLVVKDGFEWNGEIHRSLSVIASQITGTRWNGWQFFGLKKAAATTARSAGKDSRVPSPIPASSHVSSGGSHG